MARRSRRVPAWVRAARAAAQRQDVRGPNTKRRSKEIEHPFTPVRIIEPTPRFRGSRSRRGGNPIRTPRTSAEERAARARAEAEARRRALDYYLDSQPPVRRPRRAPRPGGPIPTGRGRTRGPPRGRRVTTQIGGACWNVLDTARAPVPAKPNPPGRRGRP